MAKTLQHRRGTTAELASVTGAIGEIFMDTTKNTLVVMDGTTPGGQALALEGTGGSGASYDQSLNTTDDVVFNSALVGDVSVVGNTVSGVDSYGNADTLVVDGDFVVKQDASITSAQNFGSGGTASYSYSTASGYPEFQFSQQYNGWPTTDLDTLASLQPGTVVQFTNLSTNYGSCNGYFTVVSSTKTLDYYGFPVTTIRVSGTTVTAGASGFEYLNSQVNNINFSWSALITSSVDALSVTSTGVNVEGTLTVNGQAITAGGSGASYDQSLNTTDDVVFNSALVGDVSVIGNTIGGVDAYGNADTLIVDGNLTVAVETGGIVNHTLSFVEWVDYAAGGNSFLNNNGQVQIYVYTPQIAAALTSLPIGTTITKASTGNYVTLTSVFTQNPNNSNIYIAQTAQNFYEELDGNVTIAYSANELTTINSLSVTDTGVNVEGALTVNGAPLNVLEDIPGAKVVTATANLENTTTYDNPNVAVWGSMDSFVTTWNESYFPQFFGKRVFRITFQQYGTTQESDMLSLNIGDQLILPGWSGVETTRVTLASQFARYDNGAIVVLAAELTTDSPSSGSAPLSITLVRPYTQSASFSFAADGNFVAPSLLADSALIGDVSIVGNAIAGVDSYGNPDDLVLEGTVVYTGETSQTPINTSSVNKWLKVGAQVPNIVTTTTQYNTGIDMTDALYSGAGQEIQVTSPQSSLLQALLSLPAASTIDILLSGIGWSTVTVTSVGSGGGGLYIISVAESLSSSNIDAIKISTTTVGPDVIEYFYLPLYK